MTEDPLLRLYDFAGVRTLVDVGGGSGQMLTAILRAHPTIQGELVDLPHARKAAEARIAELELQSRCRFVVGDFFKSITSGGDVYLMKSVLHDWNDEECLQILENCRSAAGIKGRLLVVEQMLPNQPDTSLEHQSLMRSDLNMLVALGGAERTESELRQLLDTAGFSTKCVVQLGATFTMIEAVSKT